jgi:DmsE family decaheme c-type cytochrome
MRTHLAWWAIYISLGVMLVSPGLSAQTAQAPVKTATQSKASTATSAKESAYVGADTCKTCHEEIYNGWEKSPHWKQTYKEGGLAKHGCEDCHGPGSAHVEGGGDKTKIFVFEKASNKEINSRCLSCHAGGTEHMKAINSIHSENDVSCTSCHSPHHPGTREFLLIKATPQLCYGCHLQQKPLFDMPFHHRVNEGLIQCTDCHNPHGTVKPKQVRTSPQQDAICFTCHADKQGPYVFEHDPVKTEGCMSCHVPHGSPNQHMLRLSTVNLLCLQCHTNSAVSAAPSTPGFHNQAAQFQACTLCHTQIHGSNFDRFFFK